MSASSNTPPAKFVEEWEMKLSPNLKPDQKVELMIRAIDCIVIRARGTLSSVILKVIIDRVLHQSREQFPFLSSVTLDGEKFNFHILLNNDQDSAEFLLALRYLLVELITVLGRITANIMTMYLYRELLKVKLNVPEDE